MVIQRTLSDAEKCQPQAGRSGEVLLERDGSVIPDQARRPSRWEEHFKDFLNLTEHPNTTFLPRDTPAA